ncbi:HNH endonuclease [Flavobacterium piscis]|uniref:HNH endonuclease n=1 Tax=Flavobacterium piscis TaxID=1114874 RepID=A0ABX2XJR2_9FLAO|nr:HNH endonuclease [Flavobacterium piscis]OCB75557.1 hypothetical protein FLP_08810 [Flavobacterium piscis]OXE95934.1 HNH endonuclease [Flavobacterium piscis]
MQNRDDFTSKTKDILSKRVSLTCSNPDCQRPTSGPNTDPNKATNIGVAAHISAAASGGPRYDDQMDSSDRTSIENGIWLCVNCSTLIDRDHQRYTKEILKEWKFIAEQRLQLALQKTPVLRELPFIEADLTYDYKSRMTHGYSSKNLEFEQPIPAGTDLYQYWTLKWKFKFSLHNNSEVPAYNVAIAEERNFLKYLQVLPRINNLQPFQSMEVEAIFLKPFHGTSTEADTLLTDIPEELNGARFLIIYNDTARSEHRTTVTLYHESISNERTS